MSINYGSISLCFFKIIIYCIVGDSIRISHLGTTILVIVKLAKDEEIFDEELITAYDFLAEVLESQEILMNAEKLQALLVDIMIERGLINPTPGKKGEPQTEQLPTYKEFPDWLPQQLNIFNLNEN